MLSTVGDLLQFGNIMLYSYQCRIPNSSSAEITYSQPVVHSGPLHTQQSPTELKLSEDASPTTNQVLPGFLKHQTVSNIWTPVPLAKTPKSFYGMGWMVVPSKREYGFCEDRRLVAAHSGAAVGASSVLLIMPGRMEEVKNELSPPKGIVVSILTNLQQVSLWDIGFEIVKNFDAIATCSI